MSQASSVFEISDDESNPDTMDLPPSKRRKIVESHDTDVVVPIIKPRHTLSKPLSSASMDFDNESVAAAPPPRPVYRQPVVTHATGTITRDPCLFTDPNPNADNPNVQFLARALIDASIVDEFAKLCTSVVKYTIKSASKSSKASNRKDGTDDSGAPVAAGHNDDNQDAVDYDSDQLFINLEWTDNDGTMSETDVTSAQDANRGHLRLRFASIQTTVLDTFLPVNYIDSFAPYKPASPDNPKDPSPSVTLPGDEFISMLEQKAKFIIAASKKNTAQIPIVQVIFFSHFVDISIAKHAPDGSLISSMHSSIAYSTPGKVVHLDQSRYQIMVEACPPDVVRDMCGRFAIPINDMNSRVAADIKHFLQGFKKLCTEKQFAQSHISFSLKAPATPTSRALSITMATHSDAHPQMLNINVPFKFMTKEDRDEVIACGSIKNLYMRTSALLSAFDHVPDEESTNGLLIVPPYAVYTDPDGVEVETDVLPFLMLRYTGPVTPRDEPKSAAAKNKTKDNDFVEMVEENNDNDPSSLFSRRPWVFYYAIRLLDEEAVKESMTSNASSIKTTDNPMWNFTHMASFNPDGDITVPSAVVSNGTHQNGSDVNSNGGVFISPPKKL